MHALKQTSRAGGLGAIGSLAALWLAQRTPARLRLLGRTGRLGRSAPALGLDGAGGRPSAAPTLIVLARCDVGTAEEARDAVGRAGMHNPDGASPIQARTCTPALLWALRQAPPSHMPFPRPTPCMSTAYVAELLCKQTPACAQRAVVLCARHMQDVYICLRMPMLYYTPNSWRWGARAGRAARGRLAGAGRAGKRDRARHTR